MVYIAIWSNFKGWALRFDSKVFVAGLCEAGPRRPRTGLREASYKDSAILLVGAEV